MANDKPHWSIRCHKDKDALDPKKEVIVCELHRRAYQTAPPEFFAKLGSIRKRNVKSPAARDSFWKSVVEALAKVEPPPDESEAAQLFRRIAREVDPPDRVPAKAPPPPSLPLRRLVRPPTIDKETGEVLPIYAPAPPPARPRINVPPLSPETLQRYAEGARRRTMLRKIMDEALSEYIKDKK